MNSKPIVYEDNETVVYRASAIGNCIKALVLARLGYDQTEPGPIASNVFADGRNGENTILDLMADDGWTVHDRELETDLHLRRPQKRRIVIRGHIDGIANKNNEKVLLEMKTMAESTWQKWLTHKWDAFPAYAAQISTYMHTTELAGMLVIGRFGDNDNPLGNRTVERIETVHIPEPLMTVKELGNIVTVVEQMVQKNHIPDCDITPSIFCPYAHFHEPKEVETVNDPDIENQAEMVWQLSEQEKQIVTLKKAAQKVLLETLNGREKTVVKAGDYECRVVSQSRKGAVDMNALANKHSIDLDDYRKPASEVEFVRVTIKEDHDVDATTSN